MNGFANIVLLMLFLSGMAAGSDHAVIESVHATQGVPLDLDPTSAFWRASRPVYMERDGFEKIVPHYRNEVRTHWTKDNLYSLFVCPYVELHLKPSPNTQKEARPAGSGRKVGEVDFGPAAPFDEDETTLSWYGYLFKNIVNDFSHPKPVKLFVMGANQWPEEDDWPLVRARNTRYFLPSGGKANSAMGDGSLVASALRSDKPDQYVYDPRNPAPTFGGPFCCGSEHLGPGPRDQRAMEARSDVLVYSTRPPEQGLEVTGPVQLELFAKSSAVDTDFTAKLVDVGPDGFAQNLTEGIVRARYRDSQEKAELMNPGQIYKFTLDLWAAANVFRKGHALQLEISSSNFPRFDKNQNTGDGAGVGGKSVPATNTIYHDAEHPSVLVLPIVPTT